MLVIQSMLVDPDFPELRRLTKHKSVRHPIPDPLGPEMISFFKKSIAKRQTKLGKLASVWGQLVPESLAMHCALESFNKGSLTVIVDSSPHLFELKQMMLAGLQQQMLFACRAAGLRKITLKPGRWYDQEAADRRVKF